MSKVYEYVKIVKGNRLHEEIKAAGFLVETVYSKYNYQHPELSEPYCVIYLDDAETKAPWPIVDAHVPGKLTAEELYQKQLVAEFNSAHEQAILAYKNWGSLTLAQKDAILKSLVKWALWKDGWLKLGVL